MFPLYKTPHSGLSAAALLIAAAAVAGCADLSDSGEDDVIGTGTYPLSTSALLSIEGTYTNCSGRSDGSTWTLRVTGGTDTLSVRRGDTACTLKVTKFVASGPVQMTHATGLTLTESYAGAAVPYALTASPSAPVLYANAKLSTTSFTDDFVVSVIVSDDPSAVAANKGASFYAYTATLDTATVVPAPTYTLSFAGMSLSIDVSDKIYAASGTASLTAGATLGTKYAIVSGGGLTTYAQVDAAYRGATQTAIPATFAPAAFGLAVGADLSDNIVRTLIIANTVNDVNAYQVFTITFSPAS